MTPKRNLFQIESKNFNDLESKLREFKSVVLIYKGYCLHNYKSFKISMIFFKNE